MTTSTTRSDVTAPAGGAPGGPPRQPRRLPPRAPWIVLGVVLAVALLLGLGTGHAKGLRVVGAVVAGSPKALFPYRAQLQKSMGPPLVV